MTTTASLFTGGGLWDVGAKMAGLTPVWGVEIRPDIAAVAERNIPGLKVIVSDVAAADYASLPKVDHLHASPSCKNASQASDGEEAQEDISSALAVCRALREVSPTCFTLENVWQYREFESFKLIVGQLVTLGYKVDWWHLNAANYGVPQTRKRLILIARKDRQPRKPQPTHSKTPDMFGLYKLWVGWYEAIEDLIDTLPDSEFAPWQLSRLPDELKSMLLAQGGYDGAIVNREPGEPSFTITSNSNQGGVRAVLIPGDNGSNLTTVRGQDEPMVTLQTRSLGQCPHRALLVSSIDCTTRESGEPSNTVVAVGDGHSIPPRAYIIGQNYGSPNDNGKERKLNIRQDDEPIFTIETNVNRLNTRAIERGRVVKMTPRALARFQSIPDWYQLPESNNFLEWIGLEPSNALACEIIGNGVPPLLAKAVCEAANV